MSISTKSPRFDSLVRILLSLLLLATARGGQVLPVYLADNHAETFGWITRNFDLDEPHVLVLVDAHSDASAAERSEELREELRRVPSERERAARVERWREDGRLQAFNWIEPLMPRPIDRVLWLAAAALDEPQLAALDAEAHGLLDGRLEVEPRSAGGFGRRWETCGLTGFRAWNPGKRPVILAIDLDFFAGMEPEQRELHFETIWARAMSWPGLAGVAFSVSRPWLTDSAEADALVALAVDAVWRTRGARLEIDASADDRPDTSLKAAELKHGPVPRWDLTYASAATVGLLAQLGARLFIRDRAREWEEIPADAAGIEPIGGGEIDCDGVWRFPSGGEPVLRLNRAPADATGKVRWQVLESANAAYDLLPETGLGKSFSNSPGRWIYEKRRSLARSEDFLLAPAAWRKAEGGRARISAEYETPRGWLPVAPIELRVRTGEGFLGSLSECLGMPYVFGIGGVAGDDLSGVETGWGSDCANLLIHAWRRNGIPLAWGDPGGLRAQLVTKAEGVRLDDPVKIGAAEIRHGIAIDFGQHVAAVWEDREPLGVLDGNDLVIHHLGGLPEIVELSQLTATRPVFALRVPRAGSGCRVAIAGDVVLAGEPCVVIDGFGRGGVDLFLANLEGIPSLAAPEVKPRYDFRFPPERLAWLKAQGVDAVSLANNHAGDAGKAGLMDGIAALEAAGIHSFGAGRNEADACEPWRAERNGVKFAVFGISYLEAGDAGPETAGVAGLPRHREILESKLGLARARGERVIVLVHGGDEYSENVNETQRRFVRWLAARGAVIVAGAHPHVIQREEKYGGAVILHSLGNAVYPEKLKGADSGVVRLLDVP